MTMKFFSSIPTTSEPRLGTILAQHWGVFFVFVINTVLLTGQEIIKLGEIMHPYNRHWCRGHRCRGPLRRMQVVVMLRIKNKTETHIEINWEFL